MVADEEAKVELAAEPDALMGIWNGEPESGYAVPLKEHAASPAVEEDS